MNTVPSKAARDKFAQPLLDVENAETVVDAGHGVPIARLVPMGTSRDDARAAMEDIHRFREEHRPTLGGVTIRELIEEGRE